MKFDTIREYFYKMYNVLYGLILLPLAAFIFVYLQIQSERLEPYFKGEDLGVRLILIVIGFVILTDLIVSSLIYNTRLKSVRRIESLGERLMSYYKLTVVRFSIVVAGLMVLAGGFYLTESQYFTGMFVVSLGLLSLVWPIPSKVCKDLQLRGDERLMVLYKKENLY